MKLATTPCTTAKFSDDGSKLLVLKSESLISVYDSNTLKEIGCFQVPKFLAATLSPRGTYLQTFQKSSTPQEKNVVLWNVVSGETVYHQYQKNMTKTTW